MLAGMMSLAMLTAGAEYAPFYIQAAESQESAYTWEAMRIGGGGYVSGIITGKKAMYARTDVGGAYRYNYSTDTWEQLFSFLSEADRGLMGVDAIAIDPTNDDIAYFLCGCAYFSGARTVIFKTTDGGKSFTMSDVSSMIQVHGNGDGRQFGEAIAIDPDDPDTIYCGGDVCAGDSCLIKSTDGGKTWKPVQSYGKLGLYQHTINWPTWTNDQRHALVDGEYSKQNGVSTICIYDGTVYVGTAVTGKNSVVAASVKDDVFTDISSQLDPENYPSRITPDGNGNLYFAFQGAVRVCDGSDSGSVKKLNVKTGKVTDISPLKHLYRTHSSEFEAPADAGYSGVSIDPTNPNRMICSTSGMFLNAQLWQQWTEEHGACWGDKFFKTEDSGEHWIETTPGLSPGWNAPLVGDYLADGGYAWIRDKAIHWVGAYVIDPVNPDRSLTTSGNGVFVCDNTWGEIPQFHFQPDGIEEVVALDFVSTPDGLDLSAIGDYDGFIHSSPDNVGEQYQPNMGSTSAIAVCPQNTDIWARIAEGGSGGGYYTTDRGKTWTAFKPAYIGGKISITELKNGKYRILNSSTGGAVSYSDDFGATWTASEGIHSSKGTFTLVDPEKPNIIYASAVLHNEYWAADLTKTKPTFDESHYSFCISTDYGATFTETPVARYDQCDHTGDLAYLDSDTIVMAAGWEGLYKMTDQGRNIEKLPNVSYAKCIGYGAPAVSGNKNALYLYGKPLETDTEGIYRSDDGGVSWVCINTTHLFGGTGNGNFLVGDMDEYGKVYMSTVGCGIICGEYQNQNNNKAVKGDVNQDGKLNVTDVVLLQKWLLAVPNTKLKNWEVADLCQDGKLDVFDLCLMKRLLVEQT